MADPIIEIDNVSIMFGDSPDAAMTLADQGQSRADIQAETGNVLGVHNCTLDIAEGEIVVLMGLSGSGKSTLLRAVNRLNPITRGDVRIQGDGVVHSLANANQKTLKTIRSSLVSMVFQQFALLPWRSVSDNVGLGLELAGMPKPEREAKVAGQLELVGLSDWADRQVGELSGGMQQRVGLARAFATGAPILLMDEPFSALDPLIRTHLQDELLDLQSRLKKTIVFVSHDLDEALKIGNRIAIMEGGRIIQCGTAQDILLRPADEYVSNFVANMNPLAVLRAQDVANCAHPLDLAAQPTRTAKPSTPIADIIGALSQDGGAIALVENGRITGSVNAEDVVSAIAQYRRGKGEAAKQA